MVNIQSISRNAQIHGAAVEDQVRMLLEPTVPLLDVEDGFTEIFMIGDGDMDRVHAALAHLAEDTLRPVGVLQIVYTVRAGHWWPLICAGAAIRSVVASPDSVKCDLGEKIS